MEVDVAIVGAGITGVLNAYLLSEAGLSVAVFEAKKEIAADTTMFTTAFITKVIDTGLSELVKIYGAAKTRMIWESGQAAIATIAAIIKKEKIDCEFKRVDYFAYANNIDQFYELEAEYKTARELGFETSLSKRASLGFKNFGSWKVPDQAQFDPEKFVLALAKKAQSNGAKFFVDSEVKKIKGKGPLSLGVNQAKVKANYAIIATYKPFGNSLRTFMKKGMYQSYVYEARLPKDTVKEGLYVDLENPYHYLRLDSYPKFDRLIIGGEDHREEIKMSQNKNFEALKKYLESILPDGKYKLTKRWTGPILESSDGIALIGEVKPKQLVASAFSGNGMTYSAISALMFRDIILGTQNPWTKLYDPRRALKLKPILHKARDYTLEMYHGAIQNSFK